MFDMEEKEKRYKQKRKKIARNRLQMTTAFRIPLCIPVVSLVQIYLDKSRTKLDLHVLLTL